MAALCDVWQDGKSIRRKVWPENWRITCHSGNTCTEHYDDECGHITAYIAIGSALANDWEAYEKEQG